MKEFGEKIGWKTRFEGLNAGSGFERENATQNGIKICQTTSKIPAKRVSRHVIPFAFGLLFVKLAGKRPFFAKQISLSLLRNGLFQ
jgi:hypothetical protein